MAKKTAAQVIGQCVTCGCAVTFQNVGAGSRGTVECQPCYQTWYAAQPVRADHVRPNRFGGGTHTFNPDLH